MIHKIHFNLERTVLAIFVVLAISLFIFLLTSSVSAKDETCLKWDSEVENIAGTLINIGEMPKTYWKLILPKPICVSGKVDGEIEFSEDNIHDLHLMLYKNQYPMYEHLLSKKVIVTGILYPAHMPHHISKVLLVGIRNIRLIVNKELPTKMERI